MGDKLLVRIFNVGVGDCIYIIIPNDDDGFHILIDCGTISSIEYLKYAINNIKVEMLPNSEVQGKKRLDLMVATHRHRDHIKGFDPKLFVNVLIKNIWLSPVMNQNHKQAEKTNALNTMATNAMREIEALGISLSPPLKLLVSLYSLDNDDAMQALREFLPKKNEIKARYVHAGMSQDEMMSKKDMKRLKNTSIRVLAPENDIDGFYLGKEFDDSLKGLQKSILLHSSNQITKEFPENISFSDFRLLQSRMLSNAFAFAEIDSSIQNNTSIVLLIEWRNRRLLFTGDAEWEGEYEDEKHNGSWNVMWKMHNQYLKGKLDFIKIGHHGSFNATPWLASKGPEYEVNKILNTILPLPTNDQKPVAQAVISTQRTRVYESIPAPELLVELGKRVKNTKKYYNKLRTKDPDFHTKEPYEGYWENERLDCLKKSQPLRTDMEIKLTGDNYIDVEIEPGD